MIGTGLIIACLAMFARLALSYRELTPELDAKAAARAIEVCETLIEHGASLNEQHIRAAFERLVSAPEITAVSALWRPSDGAPVTIVVADTQADFTKASSLPLSQEAPLGELQLVTDPAPVARKLKQLVVENLLLIVFQAVFISAFLFLYMERILARHLRAISDYAKALQLDRLDRPFAFIDKPRDRPADELDQVAEALNHMRQQLLDDLKSRELLEKAWQREKEEKLASQRKIVAAEAANRAKSQFIASVSHEVRTPLHGMLGMLDLLANTQPSDQQQQYLDTIQRSGQSLLAIINDILDYSTIEADKMTLASVRFDLDELLHDCVQLFAATRLRQHIELYLSITPDTPVSLQGDPLRVKQVLVNLTSNAFRFTEQGFVQIAVSLAASSAKRNPRLRFAVRDTGVGIAASALSDLFEPFQQVDGARRGGSGLGLAIAQKMVRLMGGDIGVESTPKEGSTFWFELPFKLAEPKQLGTAGRGERLWMLSPDTQLLTVVAHYCEALKLDFKGFTQARDLPAETRATVRWFFCDEQLSDDANLPAHPALQRAVRILLGCRRETATAHPYAGVLDKPITRHGVMALLETLSSGARSSVMRAQWPAQLAGRVVLVAEDNQVNRMVLDGQLKQLQITAVFAPDGAAALRQVQQQRPDLILMDLEMPHLDGFAATEAIGAWLAAQALTPIPIIALSAHVDQAQKDRARACGMLAFIEKPVQLPLLAQLLTEFL